MYLITPNQLQTILLTHFSLLVRVWLRGYSECCWSRWHHLPEMYGFSETGTYRGNRETCQRSLFVTLRPGLPFMLVLHHLTIVMLKWLPFLYLVHVVGFVLVMLIIEKWLMWYPRLLSEFGLCCCYHTMINHRLNYMHPLPSWLKFLDSFCLKWLAFLFVFPVDLYWWGGVPLDCKLPGSYPCAFRVVGAGSPFFVGVATS